MKSFEQIAKAMYKAFRNELYKVLGGVAPTEAEWDRLDQIERAAFIEAAKAAHKEITEVH